MRPFNIPPVLSEDFHAIGETLKLLSQDFQKDTILDLEEFTDLVGDFTRDLNRILHQYPDLSEGEKDQTRPHALYLRQLQGYLVFLLRFPRILQVPHHAEIQQTLDFILQREDLLDKVYDPLATHEKQLLSSGFRDKLEACLEHRLPPAIEDREFLEKVRKEN